MTGPVGVVFDLDGVLVDSEHLWERGWVRYAGEHGVSWTDQDTASCQGRSTAEWSHHLGERSGRPATEVARAVIAGLVRSYEAGEVPMLPAARELVVYVSAHVPVALASSAPRAVIDLVMDGMGLGRFFSATVSSAEVERGKPSPDVYREAVRRIGVDAARSYAVEDSSNGVRAASAAGLTVIAVPTPRYPLDADATARSLLVVANREQVRDALAQLIAGGKIGLPHPQAGPRAGGAR